MGIKFGLEIFNILNIGESWVVVESFWVFVGICVVFSMLFEGFIFGLFFMEYLVLEGFFLKEYFY